MRAVVQRVSGACVRVDGGVVGVIAGGVAALIGVADDDVADDAGFVAEKIVNLRIFDDAEGRMNRSLLEIGGSALVISQFTLMGDARRGRRPSYAAAASGDAARALYEMVCDRIAAAGAKVARGEFGAHMAVELVNDGPVTILLDSRKLF